jgi:hypothetical protein
MTTNIPFFNGFTRIYDRILVTWHVHSLPDFLSEMFNTLPDLISAMLIAETSSWNTSGHLNTRNAFTSLSFVRPFVSKVRNIDQFPVFIMSVLLSITVFSTDELRQQFELQFKSGTPLLPSSNFIYVSLRRLQKYNSYIDIKLQRGKCFPQYSLKDTLLDVDFLLSNKDARAFAFHLIQGNSFSESYGIKLIAYKHVNFNSQSAEVNSISTHVNTLTGNLHLEVAPWSNIKKYNNMYDPLITQAYLALFLGSHFINELHEILNFGSVNITKFEISLDSQNYFIYFISFFYNLPGGMINPSPTRKGSQNFVPSELNSDDSASQSTEYSFKNLQPQPQFSDFMHQVITFANNLYPKNRNGFYQFVRINSLYNVKVFS